MAAGDIVKNGGCVHLERDNCYMHPTQNRARYSRIQVEERADGSFITVMRPNRNQDARGFAEAHPEHVTANTVDVTADEERDSREEEESKEDDTAEMADANDGDSSDENWVESYSSFSRVCVVTAKEE